MHTCTFIFNQTTQNPFTSPSGCGSTRSRFSWHPWRRLHLPWLTGTPTTPRMATPRAIKWQGWWSTLGRPTCFLPAQARFFAKKNRGAHCMKELFKTAIQVIQPYSETCDGKLEIYLCFRLNGQFYIYNMNICEVVMLMPPAVANAITSKSCLNSHLHVSIPHSHGSITEVTELNMAWRTHTHTELDSYYSYRFQSNATKSMNLHLKFHIWKYQT